jgi:DNA-binding LacI/PurR family transcriptional regulator
MANMKEIAKIAGVSLGTVPHVLNNSMPVREPLRKRVMEVVDALGYQPSQLARGLRRDKTNMIGMIIPDITNPFFPAVVRGAEDVAFTDGYRLVLCNSDNDHAKEIVHLNELRTYLPSGLIVIPSSLSDLTPRRSHTERRGRRSSVLIVSQKTGTETASLPTTRTAHITRQATCFGKDINGLQ